MFKIKLSHLTNLFFIQNVLKWFSEFSDQQRNMMLMKLLVSGLLREGWENVRGYMQGSMDAWPVVLPTLSTAKFCLKEHFCLNLAFGSHSLMCPPLWR